MPFFSVDLDHMRAVKNDRHQKFATDNNMSSHFISARTDDQVPFLRSLLTAVSKKPDPGPRTSLRLTNWSAFVHRDTVISQ